MFIDRVNIKLKEKGIKGSDLCKRLDIPTSNYTQWKLYVPRGTLLKRIADELDVSIDWLMEREGAPEPDEVNLLDNYRACDEAGKETITSIAELQAKRCRQNSLKPFA